MDDDHCGLATRAVILYFGDHDPDGWEIPRSALRNLNKLQAIRWMRIPITMERVALTMDQITQSSKPVPPFPAKMTSSRYASYIREHNTDDAWELDALDPLTLRALIESEVESYFDPTIRQENIDQVDCARAEMRDVMSDQAWIDGVLTEGGTLS